MDKTLHTNSKDEELGKDELSLLDRINAQAKNLRPVSAKGIEFFKPKRPNTTKHLPISIKKERTKKLEDYSAQTKLKSRRINIEKERLFEENMALKLKNNGLLGEIVKLRTRLTFVEKELNKKEDQPDLMQSSKPVHLINGLKSSIKELKSELFIKNEEIGKLKMNIKSTKINEIELEVQAYIDECTRLRHHLEEIMKQRDTPQISPGFLEENPQTTFVLNSLKKENDELNKVVLQGKEDITRLKEKLQEAEKARKKNNIKKNELISAKNEINRLKSQLDTANREVTDKENQYKDENGRVRRNLTEAQSKMNHYESKIKELIAVNEEQAKKIKELMEGKKLTGRVNESKVKEDAEDERKRQKEKNKVGVEHKKHEDKSARLAEEKAKKSAESKKNEKKTIEEHHENQSTHKENEIYSKNLNNESKVSKSDEYSSDEDELIQNEFFENSAIEKEPVPAQNFESKIPNSPQIEISSIPDPPQNHIVKLQDLPPSEDSKFPIPPLHSDDKPKTPQKSKDSEKCKNPSKSPLKPPSTSQKASLDHLSFMMQINRIPKSQLSSTLFSNLPDDHKLSKPDLKSLLNNPLLPLQPDDAANLISFLLPSGKKSVKSLKSCLEKFTLDWEVFTTKDESNFDKEISTMLSLHSAALMKLCTAEDPSNSGLISLSSFESCLSSLSITISPRTFKYMLLLFYSHNMTLSQVPYINFIKAYNEQLNDEEGEDANDEVNEEKAKVVRHYLGIIAQILIKSERGVEEVFECDEQGIIVPNEFFNGLKRLGLGEMEEQHVMLMLEALQFEEADEVCVHIQELEEILMHYGVVAGTEQIDEADSAKEATGHYRKVSLIDSEGNEEEGEQRQDLESFNGNLDKRNLSLGEDVEENNEGEYEDDDFQ